MSSYTKVTLLQAVVLICSVVVVDQFTKWLVLEFLSSSNIAVAPFLNINLVMNRGVSFGLFSGHASDFLPLILSVVMIAIISVLSFLLARSQSGLRSISLSLIIGGAIGNLIDRVRMGAVVDFIDAHAAGYHWPSFNIADSAVVIGVCCLLVHTLLEEK